MPRKKPPRVRHYTQGFIDKLRAKLRESQEWNARHALDLADEQRETRRLRELVDSRWDEMQRLRDLVFAIATGKNPRAVVEREIEKLGGTIEPKR